MKTYVQINDVLQLMPVVDAAIIGPDHSLGIHEPVLVLRTYHASKPMTKMIAKRKKAVRKGRAAILANKFVRRMDAIPIERGEL